MTRDTNGEPYGRARSRSGWFRRDEGSPAPLRIALYSHDAMGVGHVRRNLLIAQALSEPPVHATSLLICGVHEASVFHGGQGIDCLIVPTIEKHGAGDYRPRDLRLPCRAVADLRARIIDGALQSFDPDILIVDKVPAGLCGELEDILASIRVRQRTRVVLGMREVLDTPAAVAAEWDQNGYEAFVRDHYDAVWVYGDQAIFDPIAEYQLESLRPLVRFTGYFDQRERLRFTRQEELAPCLGSAPQSKVALCLVGGGQDGFQLAQAFAQAKLPTGYRGVLVTGPLMPCQDQRTIERLAAAHGRMDVLRSVSEANWLVRYADRVVCMGGYNNILSVVSFSRPALVVPRVNPRREQWVRAREFEKHGFVDVLDPHDLSSQAISDWLARPLAAGHRRSAIDLNGLKRLPDLVHELVPHRTADPYRPAILPMEDLV